MRYFEFFDLPVSFLIDEAELKKRYYANSKKFHPDFYTLESEEKQGEILELSTLNNHAYRTLKDFDSRMQYILKEKGVLKEEGENKDMPADFLMDMMEINEKLMELEFEPDPEAEAQVKQELEALESGFLEEIRPLLEGFSEEKAGNLEPIKDYYLKKRYLLRIRENLNKFASR